MIEEYFPGAITIDGIDYYTDIQMDWAGEFSVWERNDESFISAADLEWAVSTNPETIVIGTGGDELVDLEEGLEDFVTSKGIKFFADKTEEAIKTFNILKETSLEEEGRQCKVIGLFHLT
jgi:hypothetical protein